MCAIGVHSYKTAFSAARSQ